MSAMLFSPTLADALGAPHYASDAPRWMRAHESVRFALAATAAYSALEELGIDASTQELPDPSKPGKTQSVSPHSKENGKPPAHWNRAYLKDLRNRVRRVCGDRSQSVKWYRAPATVATAIEQTFPPSSVRDHRVFYVNGPISPKPDLPVSTIDLEDAICHASVIRNIGGIHGGEMNEKRAPQPQRYPLAPHEVVNTQATASTAVIAAAGFPRRERNQKPSPIALPVEAAIEATATSAAPGS